MIELKCTGCGRLIANRDGDNLSMGNVTAKAPADLMCNTCGRINSVDAVPTLIPVVPEQKPFEVVVVENK